MADVVVVGAGIIGLTCAVRLQQAGAQVVVVSPDDPGDTVSAVAAAVWYPSHTDDDPRVLTWAARTYEELAAQAEHGVPGVVLRPTRMLRRTTDIAPPWWAAAVPDFTAEALDGVPPQPAGLWTFTVPAVEMAPYLDWLGSEVSAAGGAFLRRRITRLDDVADLAPVTVNATGLAAGELAGDPAVFPARGRIVLVANPGLHVSLRDEDDPAGMTYVHPRRHDVVLGGTYEPGEWESTVDSAVAASIVERCVALEPRLRGARVLAHRVGLRPARHGGPRVEADGDRLVHAYGHGGAGVTLSWGCADEVVTICAHRGA